MELQVGVKVLLKNPEGKYLLMRRSEYETIFKNKWDIPGGRIDVGSNLTENLAREVLEETGLTMTSEPRVIGAQDIFVPEQNRHVVRITYVGTAEGEPTLSEEHSEYQWMTIAEMKLIPRDQLDHYLTALFESGSLPSAIE